MDYPLILDTLGRGVPTRLVPVAGGCIAAAAIASFTDGSEVFVKRAAGATGMFEREANGLEALAGAGVIRVPRVLAVGPEALVLEYVRPGVPQSGFFGKFGHAFAALHQQRGKACGFAHDNFIGSTPQMNEPLDGAWGEVADNGGGRGDDKGNDWGDDWGSDWPGFFLQRRLRFQVTLVRSDEARGSLAHVLDQAESRILELLSEATEAPSLLHGDLWSGNYLVDESGEPCLIDPAVYYGHREADLAMTRLFGGFDPDFFAAYEAHLPLAPGHQRRLPVYQLYHVLNHYNLFGGGYYTQAQNILRRLVNTLR